MNDFWKKRSYSYDDLEWVNREKYIEMILSECNLKSFAVGCDLGTGTGIIAYELSKYCKTVYGIDISSDMLDIAREKRSSFNIEYLLMNAEKLEFEDNIFDFVTARMTFHHIKNQEKAVSEIFRTLKSGGKLVIAEGIPPPGARRFYTEMFKMKEKRRTYSVDMLVELIEGGGFEDIVIKNHRMRNVSINNWLKESGLSDDACKQIYDFHLDSPGYIKNAYNMKILQGDIFMDWQSAIVSGRKV